MKYQGSKRRISKHILPIMLEYAEVLGLDTWVEPFVGGANLIDKVPPEFNRIGGDANPHVIEALCAIRDYPEELPDVLSEEGYRPLKGLPPSGVNSWLRFVCSFGGKFDGGYARGGVQDYAGKGKRNAIKQSPALQGVRFTHQDYEETRINSRALIYCDPPYEGTTGYKTGAFNHPLFWRWCRDMSNAGHLVFVSEYNAPEDFLELWRGEINSNMNAKSAAKKPTEKLFLVP